MSTMVLCHSELIMRQIYSMSSNYCMHIVPSILYLPQNNIKNAMQKQYAIKNITFNIQVEEYVIMHSIQYEYCSIDKYVVKHYVVVCYSKHIHRFIYSIVLGVLYILHTQNHMQKESYTITNTSLILNIERHVVITKKSQYQTQFSI